MTEDFALIDFALSARAPAEIAEAIGRVRAGDASSATPDARSGGLLSRLFKRGVANATATPGGSPLTIQPDGSLGPAPMTRLVLTDMGYGTTDSPVRLSSPIGAGGLTLIEFRDSDGEVSGLCEGLSAELRGDEVFYFRYSGSRHPGAHFAFHVYQDGRVTRRAISMSVQGTAPEADWGGMDSGMPHPLETDSLPAPGTPNSDIMTPVRQAAILESLGVNPETLFDLPLDTLVTLEMSDAPGGLPLSEARSEIARKRQGVQALGQPAPEEPPEMPQADVPTADHADIPPPPLPETTGQTPQPSPLPSWEEEVTLILVRAVEAALPPDQQIAWLDQLTANLEGGEIDAALSEAHRVIAAGQRTDEDKLAAATRLSELFGRG